ncbi:MAG TPA: serine/threonine-protein kinase [Streptosporangiaceae bacterium]|nr:serine/threonine-protein kinase [Streptosporangiaceae bacterium]
MDGENRPAIGDFPAGSRIAGYQIQELIGRGGMAVVYRAADVRLDRLVALKVLAPELARDSAFRQRFIRESRSGAAVDHPNVIPVFEAGESEGVLFIAMRYVAGRDVRGLIEREGSLKPSRVVSIVTQIASALDTAHVHGLVHRDVKPANMLLGAVASGSAPDHVYLSDFGLSKMSVAAVSLTGTGQFLGTLDYMAPEQVEGRPIDGRTDLYALACAAFEMLTGKPPFQREQDLAVMWAQVSAPPPSVREFRPELPAAVDQVMSKALAKVPDNRHASCIEFATDLHAAFLAVQSGGANNPAPTELAGTLPPATELAFAAPSAGSGGPAGSAGGAPPAGQIPPAGQAPPAGAAHPPVTAAGVHGGAQAPANEATITEAAAGGSGPARGAAGRRAPGATTPEYAASAYGPAAGYQESRYGQGGYGAGYGQSGYDDRPVQADQLWRGSGYQQPPIQSQPPTQGQPPRRSRAMPIVLGVLVLVILGGAAALVLYLRGHGTPSGGPGTGVATGSHSSHSGSPSSSPSSSPVTPASPGTVVTEFYNAINNHQYRTAYRLNEVAQSRDSFATFKQGYADTQYDKLTITGVSGNVVSFNLTADQTNGSVKTFQGTYTVRHGKIADANVTQTG